MKVLIVDDEPDVRSLVRSALQYNSTPEHNYLVDGFIARKLEDDKRIRSICGSRLVDHLANPYNDANVSNAARNE